METQQEKIDRLEKEIEELKANQSYNTDKKTNNTPGESQKKTNKVGIFVGIVLILLAAVLILEGTGACSGTGTNSCFSVRIHGTITPQY